MKYRNLLLLGMFTFLFSACAGVLETTPLGLRENGGKPKLSWFAFQEESKKYLEEFQE